MRTNRSVLCHCCLNVFIVSPIHENTKYAIKKKHEMTMKARPLLQASNLHFSKVLRTPIVGACFHSFPHSRGKIHLHQIASSEKQKENTQMQPTPSHGTINKTIKIKAKPDLHHAAFPVMDWWNTFPACIWRTNSVGPVQCSPPTSS